MSIDLSQIVLYVFDVDGSLVETKSGATFRKTADDWQWLPGRLEKLQELHRQGKCLSFASNQGGVAYGYMPETAILAEFYVMVSDIMGTLTPEYFYMGVCFTHPKASILEYRQDDQRRKPGPGMLLEAMEHCHVEPSQTLMVGDRPEDWEAARAARVSFMWSEVFFSRIERITIENLPDLHQFITNGLPEVGEFNIPNVDLFTGNFHKAFFKNDEVTIEVTYTGDAEEGAGEPIGE